MHLTSIFKLIQYSKRLINWMLGGKTHIVGPEVKQTYQHLEFFLKIFIFACKSGCCPASVTWFWTKSTRETCSRMCCSSSSRTCSASGMTSKSSSWVPRSTQRSSPSFLVGNVTNPSCNYGWRKSTSLILNCCTTLQTGAQWSTSQVLPSQ